MAFGTEGWAVRRSDRFIFRPWRLVTVLVSVRHTAAWRAGHRGNFSGGEGAAANADRRLYYLADRTRNPSSAWAYRLDADPAAKASPTESTGQAGCRQTHLSRRLQHRAGWTSHWMTAARRRFASTSSTPALASARLLALTSDQRTSGVRVYARRETSASFDRIHCFAPDTAATVCCRQFSSAGF